MDHWELVQAERQALVDLLRTVRADQWATPSLCPGWTAHDVLAHLVSVLEAGPRDLARAAVLGRGLPPRVTTALAGRWADHAPDRLLEGLQGHVASRFAPPGLGYRAPLTDVMVHRLDIAVPLALEAHRPPESWRPVLDFLTARIPMLGAMRSRRPQVAWATTDLAWSSGAGPEVRGPAEAVGLTLSGRGALLDRLDGPGVGPLRRWATD